MNDASEVLVVILAVFLSIFLLLAIILIALLIKVTKQIKTVTAVAKNTADSVNNIVTSASKVAGPAMAARFVAEQVQQLIKSRRNKR